MNCVALQMRLFCGMMLKNRIPCCIMHLCGVIDNKIRKGEEMRLRRVHNMLIASALVCAMVVTPVFAEPGSAREEEAQLKEKKEAAQDELDNLQTELDELISKAQQLELKLIAKGEEIIQAEKDLKAAEEKKEEQYEAMKLRIKYMYESGSGTATMEKVMTSGDISSMLSQAEYTQQVHEYDRDQLKEYANTVEEIENLQDTLEEERANLEELEAENEAQQEELNKTISDKSDEISNLDEMIQEAAQRAAAEEEAARRAEEARQAAQNTGGTTGGGSSSAPSYSVSTGNTVVDRAYGKMGCPYVWGATGPNTFDCSGFVGYCLTGSYSRIGTTYTFLGWPRVSNPQPGDVCTSATHCGIYIGNGQMIHAPHTGDVVKIGPVQSGMVYVRYPY